jgi:hypothetical protein
MRSLLAGIFYFNDLILNYKNMKAIFKEPLVHFLLLGVLIYWLSTFGNMMDDEEKTIFVSQGKIKQLEILYKKTWQRSPSQSELENVINEYVLEQAAYLEGVSLGLDQNDIVITRRVRQKLDFIAEEATKRPIVTDKLLNEYLSKHSDMFRQEALFTFKQVFFDERKQGQQLDDNIKKSLTLLMANSTADITKLSNASFLAPHYQNMTQSQIEREFGKGFSKKIMSAQLHTWLGPIRSSYGYHLVYLDEKQQGNLAKLEEVRHLVLREWENEQRQQSVKAYYQQLLKRYPVTIDWPKIKQNTTSSSNTRVNK